MLRAPLLCGMRTCTDRLFSRACGVIQATTGTYSLLASQRTSLVAQRDLQRGTCALRAGYERIRDLVFLSGVLCATSTTGGTVMGRGGGAFSRGNRRPLTGRDMRASRRSTEYVYPTPEAIPQDANGAVLGHRSGWVDAGPAGPSVQRTQQGHVARRRRAGRRTRARLLVGTVARLRVGGPGV